VIANALLMALRQIARNVMRSALTTLGILIGVAAVIAMVVLGRGATARVESELSGLGKNLLFVVPGAEGRGASSLGAKPFRVSDAEALARDVPGIAAAAPMAARNRVAVNGDVKRRTLIDGGNDTLLDALSWTIAAGRPFEPGEERAGAAVAILGDRVRQELFGGDDPIDQELRVGSISLRVVGTVKPKGQSVTGQDQDDFVLIPLRTFQRRIAGNTDVAMIFLSAADGADTAAVKARTQDVLRERRHIRPGDDPDFNVRDMKEIEALVGGVTGVLTSLLAAIAAVSLLVGGIGIMNIMLVAVTERTREIGIRLAIGARAREVLIQFLVESIVLSMLGGLAGVGVGLSLSFLVTTRLHLPFVSPLGVILISFGFATFVGIFFGYFPARKAARLNPIDALRYE
jgi:putative ABC transport system permease protein